MPQREASVRGDDAPAIRLDLRNEWACLGDRRVELTPREFAVLRMLVERAGQLVTKEALLAAVWSDAVVSEAALTSCIRDLRRALADCSRAPRYIETVHRRGFRFIARVAESTPVVAPSDPRHGVAARRPTLVGRAAELARLRGHYEAAAAGQRQVVFVTGEAGIGKTALVEAFLGELGAGVRVGRGQCIEQFGAGEAYLPVLDALARLGRAAGGEALVATLERHAPAWLAHLPGLLGDDALAAVQRRADATTRDRTLRELIEAFDVLAAETPLVLVLEDLHWSDSATIELLAMLARRSEFARLLILGTYRPADAVATAHPLRAAAQELRVHGRCAEVALDFLDEGAIGDYLAGRFAGASFPSRFAGVLHANTSGNPLFLVNVIDDLVERGQLREDGGRWALTVSPESVASTVPRTLWEMVERQIERLAPPEREVLTAASVAGSEFSAAVLHGEPSEPRAAEESCESLARQGRFLRAAGVAEWPDGTVAARYAFIHALYRNVLYERIPIGHRVDLHRRLGARLERAHGTRAAEIAGELAMHFEQGRDLERAVRFRRAAADAALRRHAHCEAADHAGRALELLAALPESPAAIEQELSLQMIRGAALISMGWAAPEVGRTYARASELCARVGLAPQCFPVLIGLFGFSITRADVTGARALAGQMREMAAKADDAALQLWAHTAAGMVGFFEGEISGALDQMERASAIYDPARHSPSWLPAYWGGQDVGVNLAVHTAWMHWIRGFADRAAAGMGDALARARTLEHPYSLAFACHFAASFHECRGEVDAVRALEQEPIVCSTSPDLAMLATLRAVHRGWLRCQEGAGQAGVDEIRSGIAAYRGTGSEFGVPTYLALLAEACGRAGRPADGLAALADARDAAERGGAHYWDAELRRLEGTLRLQARPGHADAEAEACFRAAIGIARRQGARLLELRATTDLGRLWQRRGRAREAARSLSAALSGLVEGHGTRDLREARALCESLEGHRAGAPRPG